MDFTDTRCRGSTPTALYLEKLTLSLYDAYDRRDMETRLPNFICPTFRTAQHLPAPTGPDHRMQKQRDATFASTGYDAFVELMNQEYFTSDFRMKVTDLSADVDEEAGVARVWKVGRVIGLPEGHERESVTCLEWKRQTNESYPSLVSALVLVALLVGRHLPSRLGHIRPTDGPRQRPRQVSTTGSEQLYPKAPTHPSVSNMPSCSTSYDATQHVGHDIVNKEKSSGLLRR